jgi:hypothetical protein
MAQSYSLDSLLLFTDNDGLKKEENLILGGQKHYLQER